MDKDLLDRCLGELRARTVPQRWSTVPVQSNVDLTHFVRKSLEGGLSDVENNGSGHAGA